MSYTSYFDEVTGKQITRQCTQEEEAEITARKLLAPALEAAQFNATILAQLEEIDAKTIRPLRDGEADRVAELRAQAAALRTQLRKV